MDGYEVSLYYSPDDDCYVARIMEFIGCTVDGQTPEEALTNLRAAKADWIRIVIENGYSVPPPRYASHAKQVIPSELVAA